MEGRNSHLHSHLGVWTAPQSCRYAKNITWEWTNFCSASGPLCPLGSHASVRRSWGHHLLGEHKGRGHSDVMHSAHITRGARKLARADGCKFGGGARGRGASTLPFAARSPAFLQASPWGCVGEPLSLRKHSVRFSAHHANLCWCPRGGRGPRRGRRSPFPLGQIRCSSDKSNDELVITCSVVTCACGPVRLGRFRCPVPAPAGLPPWTRIFQPHG